MQNGIIHNSFYVKNERKENLNSLFGMDQGTDMYDYEFGENGELKVIHTEEQKEN